MQTRRSRASISRNTRYSPPLAFVPGTTGEPESPALDPEHCRASFVADAMRLSRGLPQWFITASTSANPLVRLDRTADITSQYLSATSLQVRLRRVFI